MECGGGSREDSVSFQHLRAVIFQHIWRLHGICTYVFTDRTFLSFIFTQIPELSTNNSPFKSSDPIKNLPRAWTRQHRVRYLVAAFWRFGPDSNWTAIDKKREIEPVSAESHVVAEKFSEAKLLDCAPRRASPFDARPRRALEACSAYVARTDSGRPCAMQSYAVGCVQSPSSPRAPPEPPSTPGRTFFTPRAFPNVSRSDGGASPSRGARRRPAERSELTPPGPQIPP